MDSPLTLRYINTALKGHLEVQLVTTMKNVLSQHANKYR